MTSPKSSERIAETDCPVTRESCACRSMTLITIDSRSEGSTATMTLTSATAGVVTKSRAAITQANVRPMSPKLARCSKQYRAERAGKIGRQPRTDRGKCLSNRQNLQWEDATVCALRMRCLSATEWVEIERVGRDEPCESLVGGARTAPPGCAGARPPRRTGYR